MPKNLTLFFLLVIATLNAVIAKDQSVSRTQFSEKLAKEEQTRFLSSTDNKKDYLRLLELERQALQISDDEPLKLGSIGSAILDIYPWSQTGHYVMSIFYAHLDSLEAKKFHQDSLKLIQRSMTKDRTGESDQPFPVLTINDAKTFAKTSGYSPVGSIYRTTESIALGALVLARKENFPLKYWFYDLSDVLMALEPKSSDDESQGWPLIRELANDSDSAAQVAIGAYLVNQRKFNSAISWLSVSSRSVNLLANSLLGRTYWSQSRLANTEKIKKEKLELAQENYLHAIALGSTQSMYTLASLYLQGHYGQNNEQAAMTLLQQAAALDHVESILYLGQLYNSGKGSIKQDIPKANKYFIQAAALEDESAVIMYGRFLISRRDLNLEYGDIKKWLKSHTSNGSAEAMVIMGNLYATGTTVPASNSSAVRWYKKAVKQDIQNSDIVNEVAWTLTVSNIEGLKRPKYAKKIMDRLMKSSDRARNQPEYLDTWAATHAASGDFDQAQVLQKEAISVATRERTEVIGILREHLELFRNGRTVTEKAP